ncbi:hypothetical protein EJ05DRAFT_496688 [Pseudovirgaria hyperparasitica]|uniref:HMG box domain-containing protein n=1 Tax=Pseudovirgaria hyperparasitica TaxID=470096 RepID=A0A6A6WIA3_9PEZI|nr:uncharacterized protein EJ05DRAFT_496688 [Pseudovirgaria hyperparasitica]KAF2761794.1 hypothetical protein EJ05DRAFT_496688 [Pseudovirgaria hyperparasitica]
MLARGLLGRRVTLCVPKTTTNNAAYSAISFQSVNQARFILAVRNALKLCSPSLARSFATKQITKKPAAKKTTTAKKPAAKKKAAPKKKTASKKKKPAAKRKVGKKVKKTKKAPKVLTDEQKTAAAAKKQRERVKTLKAEALEPPKGKPSTVWQLIIQEHTAGKTGVAFVKLVEEAKAKYNGLSPSEREAYNHTVNQNKADNTAAYEKWVKSYTPEQIRIANAARSSLRRLAKASKKPVSYRLIHDERAPKRPATSYTSFATDRYSSGDFTAIPMTEAGKLMGEEWRALNASEKQKYEARAEAQKQAYYKSFKSTFGHDAPSVAKAA